MNTTTLQAEHSEHTVNRISWNAIFAGVIIALTVASLLNLLGLGLGLTAFTANTDVAATIGIGSIIWLIFSGIVAMLIGGWVAGALADIAQPAEGILHGLVTWALATLFTFMLMATATGVLISGTVNIIGQGISGVATASKDVAQLAPQVAENTQNILSDVDKEQVMQKAEQAKQQAAAAMEKASNILGAITLIAFFALLLSAIAEALGGRWGATRDNKKTTLYP